MGLLEKIDLARASGDSKRFTTDQYISDYIIPAAGQFNYNGTTYPLGLNQTAMGWSRTREVMQTLPAYTAALRQCPPAFAAELVRSTVLSQMRFIFRNRPWTQRGRRTFGTASLSAVENPWPNATTGQMVSRMEWHAGLAGNSFVTNWEPGRLRVLRPDWTAIVYGSQLEPQSPGYALDGELIGYIYQNGGFTGDNKNPIRTLRVSEVAHWSPLPDPLSPEMGMSWVTSAVRDMQGDRAMTEHKLRFFENGATPNLVVKGIPAATKEKFDEAVDMMEANHTGIRNAYRTLYLTLGADATVVGGDMKQLDFANTQGKGETRIAMLSRVPAAILQISEGLQGSALNQGIFNAARRLFTDSWVYPTMQDLAAALSPLVDVPPDAELWFDTSDMPILREDARDAAEIEQIKEASIVAYSMGGFTRESAVLAVSGQDVTLLVPDPNWVSVQVQAGGDGAASSSEPKAASANGKSPVATGKPSTRSDMIPADSPIEIHNHVTSPTSTAPPVFNAYITVPERSVLVENTVQAANAPDVIVQGDTINVQPAAVSIPVTVQPANAPDVTVQGDTITVQPSAVSVPVTVQPAEVTVPITVTPAAVTVNMPPEEPNLGVTVERDADGNVTGVTPKEG